MPARKPTLGYPSRTAAVVALLDQGKTLREIATAIGISEKTVSALEHSAGRRANAALRCGRTPRPSEMVGRTVLFPLDILNRLAPHAARRNIHPNHLARLIVETVVDENMIDAVLDDLSDESEAA